MMRLSRYEQLEQEHREHLEACGLAEPHLTEYDVDHDGRLTERDRRTDHAPARREAA